MSWIAREITTPCARSSKLLPRTEEPGEAEPHAILVAGKLVAAYYRKLWKLVEPHDGVEFINIDVAALRGESPQLVFDEDEDYEGDESW